LMQWDFKDQLQASSKQVRNDGGAPEITYYVYDAGGQRVRKVTERQAAAGETPARKNERIYLGGFEIYREYSGDGSMVTLERETLHVMDDQQRIALVETKTIDAGDGINPPADLLTPIRRYQLSNHLGSASLELDADGSVLSYEEYHPHGTTAYQAGRSVAEVSLKRYRYTGKERDEETGLYYHGARYYASWLGRWTAADPIGIVDGINLYAYVGGNSVGAIDSSGTNSEVPVYGDPDQAYRAALKQYQRNLNQVDFANKDFRSNRDSYLPEVQADIADNIRYAQQQLRQEYRELLQFWENLPQLRQQYKLDQARAAQKAEEINQIRMKFRNAEGFVNRFTLAVGTSLFGGLVGAVVGGGAVVSGIVGGGIVGGTGSGGEELIRQSEAGEDLDLNKVVTRTVEGAGEGAVLGGGIGFLGRIASSALRMLRGGKPSTIAEALEPGLPQSKRSAEGAGDTALRNGRREGAAAELARDGEVLTTGVSGKPVPHNDQVTGVLMGTPRKNRAQWHGGCAEVGCVDKALNAGIDVAGTRIRAVNVGTSGGGHNTPKEICSSCQYLLDYFRIGWK